METGIFRCGSCEARFALIEPEIMEIGYISSTTPCMGHGTKTLSMAKFYAKERGLIIRLHPWAQDGNHDRLKKWYASNGFWDTGEGWVFNPKSRLLKINFKSQVTIEIFFSIVTWLFCQLAEVALRIDVAKCNTEKKAHQSVVNYNLVLLFLQDKNYRQIHDRNTKQSNRNTSHQRRYNHETTTRS